MQEVSKGWLAEKPMPDLDDQVIAKRFPIQQKRKPGSLTIFRFVE